VEVGVGWHAPRLPRCLCESSLPAGSCVHPPTLTGPACFEGAGRNLPNGGRWKQGGGPPWPPEAETNPMKSIPGVPRGLARIFLLASQGYQWATKWRRWVPMPFSAGQAWAAKSTVGAARGGGWCLVEDITGRRQPSLPSRSRHGDALHHTTGRSHPRIERTGAALPSPFPTPPARSRSNLLHSKGRRGRCGQHPSRGRRVGLLALRIFPVLQTGVVKVGTRQVEREDFLEWVEREHGPLGRRVGGQLLAHVRSDPLSSRVRSNGWNCL
jgi:hypothetical protein